jgi:hypothetical protein
MEHRNDGDRLRLAEHTVLKHTTVGSLMQVHQQVKLVAALLRHQSSALCMPQIHLPATASALASSWHGAWLRLLHCAWEIVQAGVCNAKVLQFPYVVQTGLWHRCACKHSRLL